MESEAETKCILAVYECSAEKEATMNNSTYGIIIQNQ